jgi:hypothetical protein
MSRSLMSMEPRLASSAKRVMVARMPVFREVTGKSPKAWRIAVRPSWPVRNLACLPW